MVKNTEYIPYQSQYYKILSDLLVNPDKKVKSRVGEAYSSFVRQIRVDLRHEFPLMDIKHTSFNNIVHELLWLVSGNNNIKYLVDNKCYIWNGDAYRWYKQRFVPLGAPELTEDEFITKVKNQEHLDSSAFVEKLNDLEFGYTYGDLGTIYGHQWRNFNYSVDQLQKAIDALKINPDTRQELIVSAQNAEDLHSGYMALPPCHNYFQFYSEPNREGESRYLSLFFNMRSCDFFLGNPYNVPSYSLLLMMVAQIVEMIPKQVVCNMVDCHLYEPHIEAATEWINRYEKIVDEKFFIETYSQSNSLIEIFGGKSKVEIDSTVKHIDDFKFHHFKLSNYTPLTKIKAPLLT